MSKPIFVCLVEVLPLKGCELDPSECAGAFVRAYTAADGVREAKRLIKESLACDNFQVVKFEWCVPVKGTEWENPENLEAEEFIREAESKGGVIYGRFDTWAVKGKGNRRKGALIKS